MNPYASQLGDQDPLRVLPATPSRLQELAAKIGPERIMQPLAPGKWSPRQVLIHLADCELGFGFRYRQALGETDHVAQPFDQDLWAKSYSVYSAEQALQTFAALRDWNLTLIRSLTPEQLEKPVFHPERGKMVFRVLVETVAGHDINHLRQLEALASKPAA
jgi:hypothetical protein